MGSWQGGVSRQGIVKKRGEPKGSWVIRVGKGKERKRRRDIPTSDPLDTLLPQNLFTVATS